MNKNACQGPFTTADQSAEQRCARFSLFLTSTSFLLFLACFGGTSSAAAQQANPAAGAGSIIVHGKFGGIIFGFDIAPKGGEGILSEAALQSDGSVIAAVETFSPVTGQIIKVVTKSQTQDDFVTLGITGTSVGLVEREHVISLFNVQRTFNRLDPVNGNKFTGPWIPPSISLTSSTRSAARRAARRRRLRA